MPEYAHPVSYSMGTEGSFSGVKRPGCETDCSPPSSAEVKNDAAMFRLPQTQSPYVRGQFYLLPGHAHLEPIQTGSEGAFPYSQQTSTMEPKNAVAKLIIANSGKTSNREIREESEITGTLHRNYKK